jgi:hypothetical protein
MSAFVRGDITPSRRQICNLFLFHGLAGDWRNMTLCWRSPLILTFSRREKEPPLAGFVKPENSQAESSFDFSQTRGALLPLSAGEGRGEGELHANPSATSLREWL